MMNIHVLGAAKSFIETIPLENRYVFAAPISALAANETKRLTIKTLRGKVREVVKQSQKTPKRIIERAERIYEKIKQTYG